MGLSCHFCVQAWRTLYRFWSGLRPTVSDVFSQVCDRNIPDRCHFESRWACSNLFIQDFLISTSPVMWVIVQTILGFALSIQEIIKVNSKTTNKISTWKVVFVSLQNIIDFFASFLPPSFSPPLPLIDVTWKNLTARGWNHPQNIRQYQPRNRRTTW